MKILTPQEILYRESEKYKRGCASSIPALWHNIAINAIEWAEKQAKIILSNPDVIKSVCDCGNDKFKESENGDGTEYCLKCFKRRSQTVL